MPTKHHSITHSIYRVSFGHIHAMIIHNRVYFIPMLRYGLSRTCTHEYLHYRQQKSLSSTDLDPVDPPIWALTNYLPMPIDDLEPSDHKNAKFLSPQTSSAPGRGRSGSQRSTPSRQLLVRCWNDPYCKGKRRLIRNFASFL